MALQKGPYIMLIVMLFLLMAGLGATLRPPDVQAVLKHPRSLFLGMASQFGWMPLIAFSMATGLGWTTGGSKEKLYAITLVLQGCTPGGSTSNMYMYFSRGDVALSVTMTVCSTMASFAMMPLLLAATRWRRLRRRARL